ncbi:MAG: hypothetical protein AAF789_12995 [Bacteroidota bacterium]
MALGTFVKISNVTNLSDARYCTGMMVDVLGFNIDPTTESPISDTDFQEIANWLAGVRFAGEFNTAPLEVIRNTLHAYKIDLIELSDITAIEEISTLGKPIIFKMWVDTEEDFQAIEAQLSYLETFAEIVIVKSSDDNLSKRLDHTIKDYQGQLRVLKGYAIKANANDLIEFPGLEMEAQKEERPGFKDYGEIMEVLEAIEED